MSATTLNGEGYTPDEGERVADLVAKHTGHALNDDGTAVDGTRLGIAVAVNGAVIPRAKWATTPVAGAIDIVTAVQGG
ncbi:sulfur carrier protein ThiS [Corynebacterium vitaeruminis]|uniref:sulfur carrier protein ThiS n=1 Tax=Corynebacterium vitaeruminis TaxID=38305 RepID=UPI0006617D72|nr:sulfur carrier protein ThiS [Corynebacterium vitaeruminis]